MGLSPALAERVDAVFADMDVPKHPGAALLSCVASGAQVSIWPVRTLGDVRLIAAVGV
jgi:hypothetical protein